MDTAEGRGFRHRKKQTDPICCPVCGVTVRAAEIEQHYAIEIDRLIKLQLNPKLKKTLNNGTTYHDPLPGCSSNGSGSGGGGGGSGANESSGCPWITFQKIRNNRHSRLRIKTKKRKADEPICPICNEHPTEDINVHVEMCLRRNENKSNGNNTTTSDDDDESIDIEGESFEEYEWAGQKRIRASSLLEGGYSGIGVGTIINNYHNHHQNTNKNDNDDEDEDLNVDGDDSQIYGPPQYSERDVIVPINDECDNENNSDTYLRRLVTGQDVSSLSSSTSNNNSTNKSVTAATINNHHNPSSSASLSEFDTGGGEGENHNKSLAGSSNSSSSCNNNNNTMMMMITAMNSNSNNNNNNNSSSSSSNSTQHMIIESLKAKIREYESQINNKIKCLICMDEFHNPAVSICCWHVHCEECWLRTLGARKLCPQCNMITSPADLRRIYM